MNLRKATIKDAKDLFDIANDPVTRKNSFSEKPIEWENHIYWLSDKLLDKNCLFYVGVEDEKVCGSIRFDIKGKKAIISYSVAPAFRGKGIGTKLLLMAEEFVKNEAGKIELIGEVKTDNEASKKCFIKNGYVYKGKTLTEAVYSKML